MSHHASYDSHTKLPNKPLLQTPQTLVEGAHVLRHVRIYDMRRSRTARR
jgi:hypothetical protein